MRSTPDATMSPATATTGSEASARGPARNATGGHRIALPTSSRRPARPAVARGALPGLKDGAIGQERLRGWLSPRPVGGPGRLRARNARHPYLLTDPGAPE